MCARERGETCFRLESELLVCKLYFFLRGNKVNYLQCLMNATPESYRSVCWGGL